MVPTSYNLGPGSRVAAGRNLGPGTAFFAFDYDDGILLTLVLDVPDSVFWKNSGFRFKVLRRENDYRIVLSAEEVINLFS
jgi:hypothetical protein